MKPNLFNHRSLTANQLIEAAIELIKDDLNKLSIRLHKKISTYTSPEELQLRIQMKFAKDCHNTRLLALEKMKMNKPISNEEAICYQLCSNTSNRKNLFILSIPTTLKTILLPAKITYNFR